MVYVVLEVSCMPNGDDKYPVPAKLRLCKAFANHDEAKQAFPEDLFYPPNSEYIGQDIYYVLWNTDEELNIDRSVVRENEPSNCGMWLDAEYRIWDDVSDMQVKLDAPQRVHERYSKKARHRSSAPPTTDATGGDRGNDGDVDDDDAELAPPRRTAAGIIGGRYGRAGAGTPWNRFA